MNDEAFVGTLGHWQRDVHQAVCLAAARAGEMRVALVLGAIVGQLEMPGALVHESLVHKPDFQQALERSIEGHFVEMFFARPPGDLVVAERFARFEQYLQYGHAAGRAIEPRRLEHPTGLSIQIRLRH